MQIKRFEDLKCWQEARILVNMVYEAIRKSPEFQKDFRLAGQITDAAVSSMSNIAEGFSRRSDKEFIQFLFVSKSSATEVQSETYVALDQKYISNDVFKQIYNQAEKVSRMDSSFITYLLRNEKKPKKLNKLNRPDKPNKPKRAERPNKPAKPEWVCGA
jgi:four helix bundle protein